NLGGVVMYYIEKKGGKITGKGITADSAILNENQYETTEEEYNNIIFDSAYTPTKEDINQQVVAKIREQYSIDDEFQMQRLGLQDSTNSEYQAYLRYVNECIAWGMAEKKRLGLIE